MVFVGWLSCEMCLEEEVRSCTDDVEKGGGLCGLQRTGFLGKFLKLPFDLCKVCSPKFEEARG